MFTLPRSLLLAVVAAPGALCAQFPQFVPLPQTMDILVVDSSYDGVWRMSDFNQDGDLNDPGEIIPFYDSTRGSIPLSNPSCIGVGPGGVVYVGDSTRNIVLALRDLDGNGDAFGAGEHTVFFDSATNLSGIVMTSIQSVTVDAIGNVFCAVANSGAGGDDMILKLTDLNGDGDANDPGEATVYCLIPNSQGSVGDSIPTEVRIGPDNNVYYVDVGATGVIIKGVYRLVDLNQNGHCNDPGEVTLFWSPPALGNAFYWGLAISRDGDFYLTDHGNNQVWRAKDLNGDGVITANEEQLFYQTSSSVFWDVILRSDGALIVCEDRAPDRLIELIDRNGNGNALDPGESREIYDTTISPAAVRPRGAAFLPAPHLMIQPEVVGLGQPTMITVFAPKAGELVGLAIADRVITNPISLPPIGEFRLNPSLTVLAVTGTATGQGVLAVPLTIPNNPSLLGVSFAFQALSSDSYRSFLSNAATILIR